MNVLLSVAFGMESAGSFSFFCRFLEQDLNLLIPPSVLVCLLGIGDPRVASVWRIIQIVGLSTIWQIRNAARAGDALFNIRSLSGRFSSLLLKKLSALTPTAAFLPPSAWARSRALFTRDDDGRFVPKFHAFSF